MWVSFPTYVLSRHLFHLIATCIVGSFEYVGRMPLTRAKSVREPVEETRVIVEGTFSELGGKLLHGML